MRASLLAILLASAPAARAAESFPRAQQLFAPLRADPRQTRLSAAYYRLDGEDKADLGLGKVWGVLHGRPFRDQMWQCQLDAEAMSYSRFKLGGAVNGFEAVDFSAGLPLTLRRGDLSARATAFHRSSHLGDDYIRRTGRTGERVSSTGLEVLGAAELGESARLYAGPSFLVRAGPTGRRWALKAGAEWLGPDLGVLKTPLRPYGAADLRSPQSEGWNADLRLAAGLDLDLDAGARSLRAELGWYEGRSPFGQFRARRESRGDLTFVVEL